MMAQLTLGGSIANACMCGHTGDDHDDDEGCQAKVEGYDGLGTCPCPRYKEAS